MPQISNPTAGDIHVNRPLTNFGQKWMMDQSMFVSGSSMPGLPVSFQSDLYYKFSRADFFRNEAQKRADGAESAGGGFKVSTDNYYTDVWAFHKDVSDRQRANQDSQIKLDESATQFVTLKLMLRKESEFNSTFFAPGIWATNNDTPDWTSASSDPIVDLRAAIQTIQGSTGFRPNRILMSRIAWDIFQDNDAVLDRIIGGATRDTPAMVMRQLIAALFEIDQVSVTESVVNLGVRATDADENEDTKFAVNGAQVLVHYAPMSPSAEEPTSGIVFNWTGFMGATNDGMRIRRYRMAEERAATRIEGDMAFDMKVIAPELGYFLHELDQA